MLERFTRTKIEGNETKDECIKVNTREKVWAKQWALFVISNSIMSLQHATF